LISTFFKPPPNLFAPPLGPPPVLPPLVPPPMGLGPPVFFKPPPNGLGLVGSAVVVPFFSFVSLSSRALFSA